jgi:hypothetical protein
MKNCGGKNQKIQNIYVLPTDSIGKTIIYNSIELFVPGIKMVFTDNKFIFSSIFNNNRFYLHLSLANDDILELRWN